MPSHYAFQISLDLSVAATHNEYVQQAFQVGPIPIYQAEKTVRNDLDRRFVKLLPCAVYDATRYIGSDGLSQKSSDIRHIPFYRKHLDEFDGSPKGLAFLDHLGLATLIQKLSHVWEPKPRRPL